MGWWGSAAWWWGSGVVGGVVGCGVVEYGVGVGW